MIEVAQSKSLETGGSEDEPPGRGPSPASTFTSCARHSFQCTVACDTHHRQWHDWQWQMRNRIRTPDQLHAAFPHFSPHPRVHRTAEVFPLAITPYYASLIRRWDTDDPVYRMAIPDPAELEEVPCLEDDPLCEEHDMPVPGLVHRYEDRALLMATTACAMYCRHCTRKRVAGKCETAITRQQLEQAASYLRSHPEIHDVIVSGGDPFTLNTSTLERILAVLHSINSIQIIRIGTRVPVTMPMRITGELTDMLRRYHPLWINTHFNHPNEITDQSRRACEQLADAGIPVGNQSVLLRGVNDDAQTMANLCRSLVRMRVRPYYLFQCDLVRGVEHFRTPISRGIEIMEKLRGRLSGLAIPTFVVDAPGGGGKIPILPTYLISTSPEYTLLRNFEGKTVKYPEPHGHGTARAGTASMADDMSYQLVAGNMVPTASSPWSDASAVAIGPAAGTDCGTG